MPTKLERLLFLQGGRCFFCQAPLPEPEASVEHLVATANGGTNDEDELRGLLQDRERDARQPVGQTENGSPAQTRWQVHVSERGAKPIAAGSAAIAPSTSVADDVELVIANFSQRGMAKPKTVKTLTSTIRSLFQKKISEERLTAILRQLEGKGFLTIDATKVRYAR